MKNKRKKVILSAFSIMLSAAGVLTIVLFQPFLHKSVAEGLSVKVLSVWNLCIAIILSLLFYQLLCRIDRMNGRVNLYDIGGIKSVSRKFFCQSFVILMVCWGIWFWLYFPGAGMNDTLNCIITFRNDNQTLAYQVLIYYGIHGLTALTHSMRAAYAILTVLQMAFMSLVISSVADWLRRKQIKRRLLWLFVAYYALMPVVADYSITLVKDTLFGVCMMAAVPLLYELIQGSEKSVGNGILYGVFLADLIGIDILRSNGKYIVVLLVVLLFFFQSGYRRYLLTVMVLLLALNAGIRAGERALIPTDGRFREAIGVPLAQIGAVLTVDGLISEQDKAVLEQLLPAEFWEENTRLSLSDPIKFHERFDNQWLNENKKEFISTWFSGLRDNLDVYMKSYLCHTYGFWNISPASALFISYNQSYFTEINNNTDDNSFWAEFCAANGLQNSGIGHSTIRAALHIVFKIAFAASMACGAGILFWICVWFMTELVIYEKYKICCVFLPAGLNWGTMMIAAPSSLIYRYSFYLVLSLPVFLGVMMMQISRQESADGNGCNGAGTINIRRRCIKVMQNSHENVGRTGK